CSSRSGRVGRGPRAGEPGQCASCIPAPRRSRERRRSVRPCASRTLVGAVGFEPTTSWSQTTRATRPRHAPDEAYRLMGVVAATTLLLGSQNPGKLAEMKALLRGLPYHVVGPREVGITEAPDETGGTFLENAVLKARHYSRRSGLLAVADDSGISV